MSGRCSTDWAFCACMPREAHADPTGLLLLDCYICRSTGSIDGLAIMCMQRACSGVMGTACRVLDLICS